MKLKRKKTGNPRRLWTKFQRGTMPQDLPPDLIGHHIFVNNLYQVNIRPFETPHGEMIELSIKRRDKSAEHDWRDFQRIKNELVGPDREAVEIYPAESRLVDTSNQYYLYVFPAGFTLPFGFRSRAVVKESGGNAVQRPFYEGEEPEDALTREEAAARVEQILSEGRASGADDTESQ